MKPQVKTILEKLSNQTHLAKVDPSKIEATIRRSESVISSYAADVLQSLKQASSALDEMKGYALDLDEELMQIVNANASLENAKKALGDTGMDTSAIDKAMNRLSGLSKKAAEVQEDALSFHKQYMNKIK